MRVVAGRYGGRQLSLPATRGTRPMTEKVRAAVFDILGPVDSLTVLDAYAGSGALGFEALSRGAARVVAVEMGQAALKAIRANAAALQVGDRYHLVPTSVETWLARDPEAASRFDVIFAMPPYALVDASLLGRIGERLAPDGVMAVNYARQSTEHTIPGLQLVDWRPYGDISIGFYKPA